MENLQKETNNYQMKEYQRAKNNMKQLKVCQQMLNSQCNR